MHRTESRNDGPGSATSPVIWKCPGKSLDVKNKNSSTSGDHRNHKQAYYHIETQRQNAEGAKEHTKQAFYIQYAPQRLPRRKPRTAPPHRPSFDVSSSLPPRNIATPGQFYTSSVQWVAQVARGTWRAMPHISESTGRRRDRRTARHPSRLRARNLAPSEAPNLYLARSFVRCLRSSCPRCMSHTKA